MKKDSLITLLIGQTIAAVCALGTLIAAITSNSSIEVVSIAVFLCLECVVVWIMILKYEGTAIIKLLTDFAKKEEEVDEDPGP